MPPFITRMKVEKYSNEHYTFFEKNIGLNDMPVFEEEEKGEDDIENQNQNENSAEQAILANFDDLSDDLKKYVLKPKEKRKKRSYIRRNIKDCYQDTGIKQD